MYGFVIMLADEGTIQLESCLGFLRHAYPDAPVKVISDGYTDPGYRRLCDRHKITYIEGQFLKRIEMGGAWWKRLLTEGLALNTKWIVRLDADTRVRRPFKAEPTTPIAGTLDHVGTAEENVLGGCQAIQRDTACQILSSGLLDDPALKSYDTFQPDQRTYRHWKALAFMGADMSLSWMVRNLGIEIGNWPDIGVSWLPPPPTGDYAATHPHKLEKTPQFLEARLRVITTCKGRLEHLKQTLPLWLAEPNVDVTVVDYNCPDGTTAWLKANHPEVEIIHVKDAKNFHLARARNIGAQHATPGWWCFWDADLLCSPGWADAVRRSLKNRRYLLANPIDWPQFGSVVVHSWDYHKAGGYDELIKGWGAEDGDFYSRLRQVGIHPGSYPGAVTKSLPHSDDERTQFYDVKDKRKSQDFFEKYILRKSEFMLANNRLASSEECQTFLDDVYHELGLSLPIIAPPDGIDVEVIRSQEQKAVVVYPVDPPPKPLPKPPPKPLPRPLPFPKPPPFPHPPSLPRPPELILWFRQLLVWFVADFKFTLNDRRPHLNPAIHASPFPK